MKENNDIKTETVPKTEQKDDAQLNHVNGNKNNIREPVPKNEQKNDKLIPSKSCDDKKESVPKKEEEEEFKLIIEENKTADKKEPVPEDVEDDVFLHEMKFNLLSKKTVSIVGENNNIPPEIFEKYYVDAILMTNGNGEPYAVHLGKKKDYNTDNGIIHFIMDNYYVKLTLIKGQYDGAYKNPEKFNLNTFDCEIVFSNFDNIEKNSNILFEFKNGKGGENKVITQAKRYQESAKIIFGDNPFFHIVIVRENLGNILSKKLKRLQKLKNFAILKIDKNHKIFGKPINSFKGKSKTGKSTHKSEKSFKTADSQKIAPNNQQDFDTKINSMKNEIMGEMNNKMNSFKNEIKNEMDSFKNEIKDEMDSFKREIKNEMKEFKNSMEEKFNQLLEKIDNISPANYSSKKYTNSAKSKKNRLNIN